MLCNFCCTSKVIQLYVYILFHVLFHYGLSQDIESSSLCNTVGRYSIQIQLFDIREAILGLNHFVI